MSGSNSSSFKPLQHRAEDQHLLLVALLDLARGDARAGVVRQHEEQVLEAGRPDPALDGRDVVGGVAVGVRVGLHDRADGRATGRGRGLV